MKKAILVVSFGTSHLDAIKNSIEKIEKKIRDEFKDYEVFRAFTSHMIINKLKERDNIYILTPEEALEKLEAQGFEEVIVQPMHIIAGEEFDYIEGVVERKMDSFKLIRTGSPIFFYLGMNGLPEDYSLFIESIKDILIGEESVILYGHGTEHHANAAYGMLQTVLVHAGFENVFVATVEGYPTADSILEILKDKGITRTKLVPLLVVAGDHVKNDMASDEEDSLKSILEKAGIKVELYMHGLGENDKFNQLYVDRIYDSIEGRYLEAGRTKKLK